MIELNNISKIYRSEAGTVVALRDIDLSIGQGEFLAITGQSGSGKSTLMNIIGCIDRPTAGTYLLAGKNIERLNDATRAQLRSRQFGYVFQSYNLLPRMPAVQQVELPLMYQQATSRRSRSLTSLHQVGLADRAQHRPHQLSGGEQQRVAIARCLVVNPRVILADEPTAALDTVTGDEILTIFKGLVEERGITVIIVTHEPHVAAYANRTIRMRDGEIIDEENKF